MDELDIAADREQIERDALVATIRNRPGHTLRPMGECYWCTDFVTGPRLFCGAECAESWEHDRRRRG